MRSLTAYITVMTTHSTVAALRPVPDTSPSSRPRAIRRPAPQAEDLGVVSQIKRAFSPRNRLASAIGLLAGAIVPVSIYQLSHGEAMPLTRDPSSWVPWALVLSGLVYSGHTVFSWARMALGGPVKAFAFAALLEGVMVLSHTPWLRLTVLGYLVAINAVGSACRLSLGRSADLAAQARA